MFFWILKFKAETFTEFIQDHKNKMFQIKEFYESKIEELKKQLNDALNHHKILLNENNNLKKINKELNNKINALNVKIISLDNKLKEKNNEIEKYKLEINNKDKYSLEPIKPGEKILGVNFISSPKNDIGHYNLVCKNTDLFVKLEERLYEDFPKYKNYNNVFEVDTRRIKRFKTLEENNIKTNDIIVMFIFED